MKILVFGLTENMGGVESFILNYSDVILTTHSDVKIDYVIIDTLPDCVERMKKRGCEFFLVPNRLQHAVKYYKRLKEIVKNGHYDCIWYNTCTLSDVTLLKIGTKAGVPNIIVHSHNSENMGSKMNMILHQIHKLHIGKIATHFYACSDLAGQFMYPVKVRERGTYCIINNAVNLQKYKFDMEKRNQVRAQWNWNGKKVIGHVGRFHKQKNHKFLIEIFEALHKKDKNTVLALIGDGGLKSEVEKMVHEKKLDDVVSFVGLTKDVPAYLQAMDLFLMPSLYEGLPMVLVEAQASGLPCCVSDVISRQARLTDKMEFVSLHSSPDEWADHICTLWNKYKTVDREKGYYDVKEKGFDLSDNCNAILSHITEEKNGR